MMKHLKLFENFGDISTICREYGITNYTINPDGSVDVEGDVNLSEMGLKKLPIRFGKVTGNFRCDYNQLRSLEGSPKEVGGNFYCDDNHLTSLLGSPKSVGEDFDCSYNQLRSLLGGPMEVGGIFFNCSNNQLTSLEGSPQEVGRDFYCANNKLTTLEGGPKEVGRYFHCANNKLTTLEGGPKEVGGNFDCYDNPIYIVYQLFGTYRKFQYSLDYNYLRGTDIVKSRFEEALSEIGKTAPTKIPGYNYI